MSPVIIQSSRKKYRIAYPPSDGSDINYELIRMISKKEVK